MPYWNINSIPPIIPVFKLLATPTATSTNTFNLLEILFKDESPLRISSPAATPKIHFKIVVISNVFPMIHAF